MPTLQVVRWFWETVHAMDEEGKRRLLFFVTGSDRVPIKGLAHLNPPHIISRWVPWPDTKHHFYEQELG